MNNINIKVIHGVLFLVVFLLSSCGDSSSNLTAGKAWGTAALIETGNTGDTFYPQIVSDTSGNALAIWQQSDGTRIHIWANRFTAGSGVWGTATQLEFNTVGDATDPHIAIDASGNAMAVWSQSDGIRYNIWADLYTIGLGWGVAGLIEGDNTGDAVSPKIAFDTSGHAIAVWQQFDGTRYNITANRYSAGTWGAAVTISNMSNPSDSAINPHVALDTGGNALAVWQQWDSTLPGRNNIMANRYDAVTGWGTAGLIEADAGNAYDADIAIDKYGNALAVWYQFDGTRNNIMANRYTSGSGWGLAAVPIETGAFDASSPKIAIDANGNALTVWSQSDGTRTNILANRYTFGSGWGIDTLIETDNAGGARYPQVAFDASGNAVAVWQQFDGARDNIWSNRYTAGTGWGAAALIETGAGDAGSPQIAVDSNGNALSVWQQADSTYYSIWSNRYH